VEIERLVAVPEVFTSSPESGRWLPFGVVFTSPAATRAALRKIAKLGNDLAIRTTLVVAQVIPYPLPLESPPVPREWTERRFRAFAEEAGADNVQIYLCRDPIPTLRAILKPYSVVAIGRRSWWWWSWERRLCRILRRAGKDVISVGTE
jgi:hypothetical protein